MFSTEFCFSRSKGQRTEQTVASKSNQCKGTGNTRLQRCKKSSNAYSWAARRDSLYAGLLCSAAQWTSSTNDVVAWFWTNGCGLLPLEITGWQLYQQLSDDDFHVLCVLEAKKPLRVVSKREAGGSLEVNESVIWLNEGKRPTMSWVTVFLVIKWIYNAADTTEVSEELCNSKAKGKEASKIFGWINLVSHFLVNSFLAVQTFSGIAGI